MSAPKIGIFLPSCGATVPPILVGGRSEVAFARAVGADGWFGPSATPAQVAATRAETARLLGSAF